MGDSGPFSVGEKVLVPHTDKFYEAKVQKAQKREDGLWYYFLHYLGWNKKWDEWVEETGLKRPGEAVVTAAPPGAAGVAGAGPVASGAAAVAASPPPLFGALPGTAGAAVAAAGAPKSKKRKTALSGEAGGVLGTAGGLGAGFVSAGAESAEGQLQIELPGVLQKQLLDQYDAIHDEGKLLQLPRRPNVMQLFQQYVQYVRDKQGVSQAEDDLVAGLQVYFDKALWQCLLYKAERAQADMMLAAGQAPSAVYGAEHLLRLIVKLPELLPHTGATGEALQLLIRRVEDLLTYMQIHAERLFVGQGGYVLADMYGRAAAAAAMAAPVAVKR